MAFWDFVDNYRNAVKQAASNSNLVEPRTKADETLTVPSPLVNPTFNVPGTKKNNNYQQVFGFEQDKANYGDERDGSKLQWRELDVQNNDTGETFKISVGYDDKGRISGVQKFTGPKSADSYYGKELVGEFFKNNFDRDATDYTIYDKNEYGTDDKFIVFDSKNDGEFIPSYAIGYRNRSLPIPGNSSNPSKELRDARLEIGTREREPDVVINEERGAAADNGTSHVTEFRPHLNNMNDLNFFSRYANEFAGIANEFSRTPDYSSRMQILENAYKKYGSNPQYRTYLQVMAEDEQAHKQGYYDNYDYSKVGNDISNAINDILRYYYRYV